MSCFTHWIGLSWSYVSSIRRRKGFRRIDFRSAKWQRYRRVIALLFLRTATALKITGLIISAARSVMSSRSVEAHFAEMA